MITSLHQMADWLHSELNLTISTFLSLDPSLTLISPLINCLCLFIIHFNQLKICHDGKSRVTD